MFFFSQGHIPKMLCCGYLCIKTLATILISFFVGKPIATQPLVPPITLIGLANPIAA